MSGRRGKGRPVREGRRALPFTLLVLVVDDDTATAKALSRLLKSYGHRVEVSHDADEAFARACELRPDVILHDVAMPSIDGYAAARRLRDVAALELTVLIACSGLLDEVRAREAGFDGWLHKPISTGELETVLALATERLRARRDEPAE